MPAATGGSAGSTSSPGAGGSGGSASVPPPASDAATDVIATADSGWDVVAAADGSSTATDVASGEAGSATGGTWSHTMCNKPMLMFPRIDRNNGVFPPGSCPPPETLKAVCAGDSKIKVMTATSSAFETGYVHPPQYAIDEHIMTRWSTTSGPTAFIRLDFGTEQTFKRVQLLWELAHGADYDLVVSNDGTNWTPLAMVRNGDGYQDIVDVEGKGRYLRLNGIRRGVTGGQLYGYSLFDFTVCGQR